MCVKQVKQLISSVMKTLSQSSVSQLKVKVKVTQTSLTLQDKVLVESLYTVCPGN